MSFVKRLQAAAMAAGLAVGNHTPAEAQTLGITLKSPEKTRLVMAELKKLVGDIAEGKMPNEGRMANILGEAISDYNAQTRNRNSVAPGYRYSQIATPLDLGQNMAVVVDPFNEAVVIISSVTQKKDEPIDVSAAHCAAVYLHDKKMRNAETQDRMYDVALGYVKTATQTQGKQR